MKKALAHGVHSDEGITAEMHIDPNDFPVIGQEARFYFTFIDSAGQFDIQRCECVIVISKEGTELDRQLAKTSSTDFANLGTAPLYTKTFSEAGDYKLEFLGNPKDGAIFQPFELDYEFVVHKENAQASAHTGMNHNGADHHSFAGEHLGHIVIFGGGLIVAIILLVRNYLQTKKSRQSNQENN